MVKQKNIIKEKNLTKLIKIFKEKKVLTKSELASLSGLSVVTVNSLIKNLLKEKVIFENEIVKPELGRPALTFRFNENLKLFLIITMSEENKKDVIQYCIYNLYREPVEKFTEESEEINADTFSQNISKFLVKYPQIETIYFSIPGVEYNNELLICDYKNIDKNFPKIIKKKFKQKIFFENDINAAICGYAKKNNIDILIGIYIPTKYPPGSGICINGKVFKGAKNLAGEIQYLPLGIDWNNFLYSKQDIQKFLINVIKIYMCLFNPSEIIIYSEIDFSDISEKLQKTLKSKHENLMIPNISIKKDLKQDIEFGLLDIAIKI